MEVIRFYLHRISRGETQRDEIEWIESSSLTRAQKQNIYMKNACKLLHLHASAPASTRAPAARTTSARAPPTQGRPQHHLRQGLQEGGTLSSIVGQHAPGSVVTMSRNTVDYVITEFGIAPSRAARPPAGGQPDRRGPSRLPGRAAPPGRGAPPVVSGAGRWL